MKIKLTNVVVYNGIKKITTKEINSNVRIINVVNYLTTNLSNEMLNKINENKLMVYIETSSDYSEIKFSNLECDDRNLMLKFRDEISHVY